MNEPLSRIISEAQFENYRTTSVTLCSDSVSAVQSMHVTAPANRSLLKHEPILQLSPFSRGES